MLKGNSNKNKCADIDYQDDYNTLIHGVTNPYNYNFGKVKKNSNSKDFVKLQHKVNIDYFTKR